MSERLPTKAERLPSKARKPPPKAVELVTAILEEYAQKAVFRGFSAHPGSKGQAAYRMVWHHDRPYELLLDVPAKTLRFRDVLPGVPTRSPMYSQLRAFLKERQSGELPEHRSVNPKKARLTVHNIRGNVSVKLTLKDGDFDYATRRIVHIVHEIFMIFLVDGPYFDYMVEQLGLDPDRY